VPAALVDPVFIPSVGACSLFLEGLPRNQLPNLAPIAAGKAECVLRAPKTGSWLFHWDRISDSPPSGQPEECGRPHPTIPLTDPYIRTGTWTDRRPER
jgi:hypothetical protein